MSDSVSMSTLLGWLKLYAVVQPAEGTSLGLTDANLKLILTEAAKRINPTYAVSNSSSNVPVSATMPVVVVGWSEVCYIRASAFSKDATVTGTPIGVNRDTPYYKCMDLAAKLIKERLPDELQAAGLAPIAYSAKVTESVVSDHVTSGRTNPAVVSGIDVPLSLTASYLDGIVDLTVSKYASSSFASLSLYHLDSALESIFMPWLTTSQRVNPNAELLTTTTDPSDNVWKIQDMPTSGTHSLRFLAVLRDTNGNLIFSNEVVINLP